MLCVFLQSQLHCSSLSSACSRYKSAIYATQSLGYSAALAANSVSVSIFFSSVSLSCFQRGISWCTNQPNMFLSVSPALHCVNPARYSPWYNRTGWLGVKHQLTYLLTVPVLGRRSRETCRGIVVFMMIVWTCNDTFLHHFCALRLIVFRSGAVWRGAHQRQHQPAQRAGYVSCCHGYTLFLCSLSS